MVAGPSPGEEFCRHLARLLDGGAPAPDAVAALAERASPPAVREALRAVAAASAAGAPLSQALAAAPKLFGPAAPALVRLGEARGGVPAMLRELARHAQAQRELVAIARRHVVRLFLLLAGILFVSLIVYGGVVPVLGRGLVQLLGGEPLPLLTRLVVVLSRPFAVAGGWWCVVLIVALLVASVALALRLRVAEALLVRLLRTWPGTRRRFVDSDYARLCLLLGSAPALTPALAAANGLPAAAFATRHVPRVCRAWQAGLAAERSLGDSVTCAVADHGPDQVLAVAVLGGPAAAVAGRLRQASELYAERAVPVAGERVPLWFYGVLLAFVVGIGLTVISIYLPFIKLVEAISG